MDRAEVIAAIAKVARKPAAEIADHMHLSSLGVSSSLGLSLLRSQLERSTGSTLGSLSSTMRVDGLLAMLASRPAGSGSGNGATHPPGVRPLQVVPVPAAGKSDVAVSQGALQWSGEIALGLDIQDVEAMPATTDYRAHEFYRSHFSPAEIATALLRPDARLHLCGIFCAKEAAKKSHPTLLELRMSAFAVQHTPAGKPVLTLSEDEPLPYRYQFDVSISHTAKFAAAACITRWRGG
jgi:holo-[acyl-carrier protein] synthase